MEEHPVTPIKTARRFEASMRSWTQTEDLRTTRARSCLLHGPRRARSVTPSMVGGPFGSQDRSRSWDPTVYHSCESLSTKERLHAEWLHQRGEDGCIGSNL